MTKVARILYKEIRGADLLKVRAISNTSPTGGGARDFRFGSYKKLLPAITLMFPNATREQRKRNGVVTTIDVLQGVFRWKNPAGGKPFEKESSSSRRTTSGAPRVASPESTNTVASHRRWFRTATADASCYC